MVVRLAVLLAAFWFEGYLGRLGLVDNPTLAWLLFGTFVICVGPVRLLRLAAGVAMALLAFWG